MFLSRLSLLAILPVLACAPKAPEPDAAPPLAAEPAELTIRMADYAFAAPDTIAPGVTRIRIIDDGEVPHQAILVRIDSGKTITDLTDAIQQGNYSPDWTVTVGGGGAITPSAENASYSDLTPGLYALICFLQDSAAAPMHVALGMLKPIVVAGERSLAAMPVADAEIRLVDFAFEMPDSMAAGVHDVRITNGGSETHEIVLIRLPDGMTLDGYLAEVRKGNMHVGQPIGGNGALSASGSNLWHVTLTAGTYAALCFVPSPSDGTPHVMKGMAKALTVS